MGLSKKKQKQWEREREREEKQDTNCENHGKPWNHVDSDPNADVDVDAVADAVC